MRSWLAVARLGCRPLPGSPGTGGRCWCSTVASTATAGPMPPMDTSVVTRRTPRRSWPGRADLGAYPTAELRHALAVKAASDGDGRLEVVTERERFVARRLVLATGVRDQFPEVEGFFEHYGASVFHCPSCDGYEAKGRPVVAIGWSGQVAGFALELLGWASQVTVVTDGRQFEGDAEHRRML